MESVSQKFAEAQHKQILKLQEKIEQLQRENKHLQDLLKAAMPLTKEEVVEALSDEELIAANEIKKLREISEKSVLTTDECKRLVEYAKILQGRRKKDDGSSKLKELSTDDLLKQLE
jgi:hypothetical protein